MDTKFRKILVNRRLFTNGCKFLIPDTQTSVEIKPHSYFQGVPVPYGADPKFGFGLVKTDIPDPDTGADDLHLWAYLAPREIKFGGEYYLEKIKPLEILVVDDSLDDDLLIGGSDDDWTDDPFKTHR